MATNCEILAQINQAISDIVTTGTVQEGRQGSLLWKKYDLTELRELQAYYRNLCNQDTSISNGNGGLSMAKIVNKEPC